MNAFLGLDLADQTARAVLVDETARLLGRAVARTGSVELAEAALSAAERALAAAEGATLTGVGLSASDPAAPQVQEASKAFAARWPLSLGGAAAPGLAGAVAEAWCGSARSARHVVFLLVADTISAGILIEGVPWSGAHGQAGAAAWLALNPVDRQDYRRYGGLAAEASARGIVRRLIWRVEAGDHSSLVDRVAGDLERITATQVFDAAREGDGVAISVVRDTVRYLGMAVANLAAVLDPEVVVLGGLVAEAADLLLSGVRQEAERRLPPSLAASLRLEAAALGGDAVAVGAARLAMTAGP